MKFEQMIHGEWKTDHEYEEFVRGWMAYHVAADEVDGHLPPGHPDQYKLTKYAVRAGWEAMNRVLGFAGSNPFMGGLMKNVERATKWQNAKLESLRRLGK